jgi:hypothetical protein
MWNPLELAKMHREGQKQIDLYDRALNAMKMYLPVTLGTGKAQLASAMVNEILRENVIKGDGVEEFGRTNQPLVEEKARHVMQEDSEFRSIVVPTLWAKWLLDRAFERSPQVLNDLENGWAFREYGTGKGPLLLAEYEAVIRSFEEHLKYSLGKWLVEEQQRRSDQRPQNGRESEKGPGR